MERALTVAIVTRDRPAALRRCLAALDRADRRRWEIELLVVDDGSWSSRAVAAAATDAGAELVSHERSGLPAARNAAAGRASTPYVLFTDDDCVPDPSWAERLGDRLEAGADAVGGLTLNGDSRDRLAEAAQLLANALSPLSNGRVAPLFVPASNFGCRADVLRGVPFDEAYTGRGAEDRDWFERVAKRAYRVEYVPEAVVRHFPELTITSFLAKSARYGRGAYHFRARHRDGQLEPFGFYVELIRRGLREGPITALLVGAAQFASATGYAAELLAERGRVQPPG